jgi:hypothetical protein
MSAQVKQMFLVAVLSVLPLAAGPHVSRVPAAFNGEVQAFDFFQQTFLIRLPDGTVQTIPFSRFTDFFRTPAGPKGHERREAIDPTEVTVGDRLQIQLDPNEATAASIEVMPARKLPARVTLGDARRPQSAP